MKKSFLLLLSLCWLTVHAQYISRTATYHFADPESIGIIPSPSNGGTVALADKTLTKGYINATFGRETQNDAPPTIWTYIHPYQLGLTEYYLRMTSGSTMTFTATSGCVIKAITFETEGSQGKLGNLQLRSGEFGILNTETGVWNDEGVRPSSVTFRCGNSMGFISKVIVSYEESSVSLIPLISPSPTDTLYSFSSLELTYSGASGNMSVVSSSGITIQGDYNDTSLGRVDTTLAPTAFGNKVLLTIADSIVKDGTFTVVVPARCFKDEEGYENTALTTTVTVREDRATFNPSSINPDTTDVQPELTFPITLQFPNTTESRIGRVDENKTFYLSGMKEDSTWVPVSPLKAVKVRETNGLVKIIDKTELNSYKDHLKYRVEIPEGVVFNQFEPEDANSRHNAALNLIYTIGEPIPVDPLKEKKDSINMLVSEVDSLLNNCVGKVGYPQESDTLNVVKSLKVEETDDEASMTQKIESLLGALKTFYNDTKVLLPEKDKWYTISSVNKESEKLYLTYANGAVTLGTKASPFKVNDINGNVAVFETADGKFLHVLLGTDEYRETSTANVTDDSRSYVRLLTLGKMLLAGEDVDQKPVAGLFTIKGGLGLDMDTSEKVGDAYALVIHGETPSIATSLKYTKLYFENDSTSAFRFAETVEPSYEVMPEAVIKDAVLTSNTQVMTLEIKGKDNDDDVTKVALKSLAGVKFTYKDGEETKDAICTADSILKPIAGSDSLFEVHVDGLADNIYTLVMPAGTFDFSQNPKPVKDTDLEVSFKIESTPGPGPGPDPDDYANYGSLPEMWGTIPRLIIGFPVVDTDLLEVYYYVTDVDVYPNKYPAYNVVTLKERWMNTFIAQGHFEAVTRDSQQMLKIVYDEGTSLTDKLPLAKGDYTLVIGRAAYGDENFNKRQNGDTSIPESECRINQSVIFNNFSVDNSVTGIKTFNGDGQLSDGKYVIDGKFVIVKGGKKFTATGVAF